MRPIILLLFCIDLFTISCNSKKEESTLTVPSLTLKWETDTLLTTCESIIYDPTNDVIYVSNIAGNPRIKDGNGSISKVGLDGKITEARWITGLDAPKGLGLFNNTLFVADIDRIVEIDISSSAIKNTYPVDSAKFLNDITIDAQGRVYASDSDKRNIVILENGKTSIWLDSLSSGPNGLLVEENRMLMVLWNPMTLNVIDLTTKEVIAKTDSLENPDGIEPVGDGGYLISSWNGQVNYVDANWARTRILDTRNPRVSAADIEYIQSKNLLLVPTFNGNTIRAYELTK
jgi:hypothetical protein